MRKFTEVLEEYLKERDRQNSNYYEGLHIGSELEGSYLMKALANELNEMVQGIQK